MRLIETASLLLAPPAIPNDRIIGSLTLDGAIMALWKKGLDTASISRALGHRDYPESRVANRLAAIRDGAHP